MTQEFDIECLGGGVAGEAIAAGLQIELRTPLKALADVIHRFPAFNRVLGASLEELAAKALLQHVAQS